MRNKSMSKHKSIKYRPVEKRLARSRQSSDDVQGHKQVKDRNGQRDSGGEGRSSPRRPLDRQIAVNRIARAASATLNLDDLMETVCQQITAVFQADAFFVALYDEGTDELDFRLQMDEGVRESPQRRPLGAGLSSLVVSKRRPLLIRDYKREQDHLPSPEMWGTNKMPASWLGVPMQIGDQVTGVLCVQAYTPHAYGEEEQLLLSTIAEQVAVAIQNAQLYQAEQKRAAQLAVVNQVTRQATSILEVNQLLREVVNAVHQGFGYYNVALFLLDKTGQTLEMEAIAGGFKEKVRADYSQPVGTGMIGYTAETGRSLWAGDVSKERRYIESFLEGVPVGSELCVPLKIAGQVICVLDIQDAHLNAFDQTDLTAMETLAGQVAVAIENARLYEKAQQELTERKQAEQALRGAEEEARRRAAHLEALNAIIAATAAATDLHDLLEIALNHTLEALGLEKGNIWVANQHAIHGLPPEFGPVTVNALYDAGLDTSDTISVEDWQHDTLKDPLLAVVPAMARFGVRASIYAPILVEKRRIGGLGVSSPSPRSWSAEETALIEAVGQQLGATAERLRLFQAEREQRELAEALEHAAAAVSSTLRLNQVLDRILEQVERVVSGDVFDIMLVENDTARVVRCRGYEQLGMEERTSRPPLRIAQYPHLEKMIQTGASIAIQDTLTDPDWTTSRGQEWRRSYVTAPIRTGDATVGFLSVSSFQPGQFGPADVRRLQTFANHAATAIQNARLFEETQQRVAELETLQRTSLHLTASLDLSAVLDTIVASALTLVGATDCHIYLYDEKTDAFTFGTALWQNGRREPAVQSPRPDGLTATVVQQGRPIVISDAPNHPLYSTPEAKTWHMQSIAGFPLKRADRILGVFTIAFLKPHIFTHEELRILSLMADQAAIAIENAQLYHQLRDYAENLEQRVQDRTAQLRAQYARLNAILHTASNGIIVTDEQGRITQTNPIAQAWLSQTLSPEDASQLREAVRELASRASATPASGSEVETTLELTGLDLELKAATVTEPAIEDTAAVVVDVHDVSHLKALDRMKSRFITNVSHELRTPVATIKLYTSLMQQKPPETWRQYIDTLVQEADWLAHLVTDILQVSHIDAGRMEMNPRPTSLNDLVIEAIGSHEMLAQEQKLTLEHHLAEPGPVALVDPDRITQVLNNLVENAIRYTPEGGRVTLFTDQEKTRERIWATVKVADTGIGIPEEELPHIFDRFFRGEKPRSMQISGTGLGLSIANEIVELHGGLVTVTSQVNEGTTFTVRLPLTDYNPSSRENTPT